LEKQILQLEEKEAALLNSIHTKVDCEQCGDTGVLNGDYCKCLRDRIYQEAYNAVDIKSLTECFENSNPALFNTAYVCSNGTTQRAKYIALVKYSTQYADSFPDTPKPNLFFTGNTGLGKTFVLRSIAKRVYQKGNDVLLIGASDLFGLFLSHRLGEDIHLELLWDCSLLLIDDLGVEPITQNVTVEYFLDLLNRRIDNKKHTIIATNLSADKIAARYGERVYSRIRFKEICDQLVFEGQDVRIL
ncbi:MAG: ATP-binding protein, partial [Eubacteriales bacterium]